jgi:hypothetical protein
MPATNLPSRLSLLLLLALSLVLLSRDGLSQGPSETASEVRISIAPTKDPNIFTISLRNVSHHGLSLDLGGGCESDSDITAVSYRLISEGVVTINFEETGSIPPCSAVLYRIADLAPAECYTYNMHLDHTTLFFDEGLVHAATAGHHFYRLQALANGEKGVDSEQWTKAIEKMAKYPLWRGSATSKSVAFPSADSPDWRSAAQRGGPAENADSPLCGAK